MHSFRFLIFLNVFLICPNFAWKAGTGLPVSDYGQDSPYNCCTICWIDRALSFKLVGKSGKGSFWFSNNGDQSGYEGKSSSDHVISEGRVECSGHWNYQELPPSPLLFGRKNASLKMGILSFDCPIYDFKFIPILNGPGCTQGLLKSAKTSVSKCKMYFVKSLGLVRSR